MLFNSIEFGIFLPIVFLLYWFVTQRNLKAQNALLLAASYLFYGWWDWRFLSLIVFSSAVDYWVGLKMADADEPKKRKYLLALSLLVNLGFLAFFKYFNFFSQSFADAFTLMGQSIEPSRLDIILPVGISFYTFQTLSYSIDVYRRNLEPTRDALSFFAYVSFFPQLVAGPIERATNLLPQFYSKRKFDYAEAVNGMRQILWGLFKKMVIADNCAEYANLIFNGHADYGGSTLFLGALFFTFQIYGDFSGYSDIAIGTARLFGFKLMQNFAFPYFSRDIAEFWRRWHISLSTWFRDYLYIPLGGSRGGTWMKVRNTFIIFIVSGFWHGANWTFIIWGFLNALYFLPLLLLKRNRRNTGEIAAGRIIPGFRDFISMTVTFLLTVIAWIFFRAENLKHAMHYLDGLMDPSLFSIPELMPKIVLILILFFLWIEWMGRESQFALENLLISRPRVVRWTFYSLLVFMLGMYAQTEETPFIYFQF